MHASRTAAGTFSVVLGLKHRSALRALAFSSGPPNGLTGGPGEGNCTQCHSTFPLNSGSGMLSLDGLPADYIAGETYDLTVTLSDPDAMRWGFELMVIEDGGAAAASVGTITATDGGTQISVDGDREYLKHNSRALMFSASMSPTNTAAVLAAS